MELCEILLNCYSISLTSCSSLHILDIYPTRVVGVYMMLIITAIILFAVYYMLKNRNSVAPVKQLTNLEILKRRYAMGEISREQYLLMLKEFE